MDSQVYEVYVCPECHRPDDWIPGDTITPCHFHWNRDYKKLIDLDLYLKAREALVEIRDQDFSRTQPRCRKIAEEALARLPNPETESP